MKGILLTCALTLAGLALAADRSAEVGRRVERTGEGGLPDGAVVQADIVPTWPAFLPYGKAVQVTKHYGDPCYAKAIVLSGGQSASGVCGT